MLNYAASTSPRLDRYRPPDTMFARAASRAARAAVRARVPATAAPAFSRALAATPGSKGDVVLLYS